MDLLVALVMLGVLLAAFGLICVGLTSPAWIVGRLSGKSGTEAAGLSPLVTTGRRRWTMWTAAGLGMAAAFNEIINGPHLVAVLPWFAFYALGSYAAYHLGWAVSQSKRDERGWTPQHQVPAHMNSPVILADEANIFSATDPSQSYAPYRPPAGGDDEYRPATPTRFE